MKAERASKEGKIIDELTAGSAKNEIANTLKQDATILPIHV
jgi:hypothetical protein